MLGHGIKMHPQKSHEIDSDNALVVGKPVSIDTEGFLQDVEEICAGGIFTNNGPFSTKLERRIQDYLGVKYAVNVSNATKGLELVLRALRLPKSGTVLIPSYTFIATAHAVIEAGLQPVFCDVDLETHLLTPDLIEDKFDENTVAIIAVNLWGLTCSDSLVDFSRQKRVPIIFDSAHAFGAKDDEGKLIGGSGIAHVFSMHATKLFNSFEGGCITTNDVELAKRLKSMRNFGISDQEEVTSWGTNAKMSEIHAAFALRQLDSIDQTKLIFREHALTYKKELHKHNITGVKLWNENFMNSGSTHSYICVRVQKDAPVTRDQLLHFLKEKRIHAKRYFFPGVHKTPFYAAEYGTVSLPNTEILNSEILALPTGRSVHARDIERVVSTIADACHVTGSADAT